MLEIYKRKVLGKDKYWKVLSWAKITLNLAATFSDSVILEKDAAKRFLNFVVNIFKVTFKYFFLPTFVAFSTQATEPFFSELFKSTSWAWEISEKDSGYPTFIATLTSISGLFIGLYYAAITSITGSIYSKAPQSLRHLLLNERLGNNYFRYLIFFTFLGVLFLSQYVLGYSVNPLNVPIASVLGGLAIFAFFKVGVRALALFEPTQLAGEVFVRISESITRLTPGNLNWSDERLQREELAKVQYWLGSIEALASMSSREKHLSGKVFLKFIDTITEFLCGYESQKGKIPRDSKWFKANYKHLSWYESSDSKTSIAQQNDNILPPEEVKDYRWIETSLIKVLISCIEVNLNSGNYSFATNTIGYINKYVGYVSLKGDLNWSKEILLRTSSICETHLAKKSKANEGSPEVIAICDAISVIPFNMSFFYLKGLNKRNAKKISEKLSDEAGVKNEFIYKNSFSDNVIELLESFKKELDFECKIEGSPKTPAWYIMDAICKKEAENYYESMHILTEQIGGLYSEWINKLTSSKQYWLAASCSYREKQFWKRLDYVKNNFDDYWSSLIIYKKDKSDWLSWDFETFQGRIQTQLNKLEIKRAEILEGLIGKKRPSNLPDYPGLFLHSQGESLFYAFLNNDFNMIRLLFPVYFASSFSKFEEIMPQNSTWDEKTESMFHLASAPIVDLITLSGHAVVLSKLNESKGAETLVRRFWTGYLKSSDDLPKKIEFIITIANRHFGATPRYQYRFRWYQLALNKLSRTVKSEFVNWGSNPLSDREVKLHNDALVRAFSEDRISNATNMGIDIFINQILISALSSPLDETMKNYRETERIIKRATEDFRRYNEGKNNDGDN